MSNFTLPLAWSANADMTMTDFSPIPTGWYPGSIVDMEYKAKNGKPDEGYIQITFEIDEGEHKGRQMFDNLNLWDQGEKIQNFIQRKINTLCVATGQHQLSDLNQLMNKRMLAHIKLQEGREVKDENTGEVKKYDARNQINNYKPIEAGQPSQAQNGVPPSFGQGQNQSAPPPMAQPSTPVQQAPAAQAPAMQSPAQSAPPMQNQQPAAPAGPAGAAGGSVPPWVKK